MKLVFKQKKIILLFFIIHFSYGEMLEIKNKLDPVSSGDVNKVYIHQDSYQGLKVESFHKLAKDSKEFQEVKIRFENGEVRGSDMRRLKAESSLDKYFKTDPLAHQILGDTIQSLGKYEQDYITLGVVIKEYQGEGRFKFIIVIGIVTSNKFYELYTIGKHHYHFLELVNKTLSKKIDEKEASKKPSPSKIQETPTMRNRDEAFGLKYLKDESGERNKVRIKQQEKEAQEKKEEDMLSKMGLVPGFDVKNLGYSDMAKIRMLLNRNDKEKKKEREKREKTTLPTATPEGATGGFDSENLDSTFIDKEKTVEKEGTEKTVDKTLEQGATGGAEDKTVEKEVTGETKGDQLKKSLQKLIRSIDKPINNIENMFKNKTYK